MAHLRALRVLLPLSLLLFACGLAVSGLMLLGGWRDTFTAAAEPGFVLTALGGLLAAVFCAGTGYTFSPPFISSTPAFRFITATRHERGPGEVALSPSAALGASSVLAFAASQLLF